MCDCFHLAFPNWHASAAGNGRRLKAPEQDTEDDLICEEPEVLEEERPRPQGSSPVEEFPTTEKYVKQAEGDFYDSPTKSSKKGKRIGFGSFFDKRSSAKMNQAEEMQNDGSEMILKTVKGGCAEGLVVSGGGKDGIFIKEVKPESPASKHLSVKEGDQILSATVYFDNVSYEDALQILEHAQPYKVEFCLKRKPAPTKTQEDTETMRPEVTIGEEAVEEGTGPEMRGRRKTKKQHDRISWPKFPTFSKGRRAKFKRSHSTSEAEEQRKLEISPATSDTESPIKSPLKSPDEKDKKKMQKIKYKMKMSGRRTKSVEETEENEEELPTDNMDVLKCQNIMDKAEEHIFQESVTNLVEIPKMDKVDITESIKTRNEFTCPTLPVTDSMHRVELISLNNTINTTDITVAYGEESREKSELKVSLQEKDKSEIGTDSQLKFFSSGMITSGPSTMDNIIGSPSLVSQEEAVGDQLDSDMKLINKDIFEITQGPKETDKLKIDVSHDMSDVGLKTKSPSIASDKEKKERKILETESYGIRTRGPLADIAISSHFANTLNRLEFTSSDSFTFDIKTGQDVSSTVTDTTKPSTLTPVISQPKPKPLDVDRSGKIPSNSAQDIKILHLEVDTSELTQKTNIDAIVGDLGKISESKFKLAKVDHPEFDHQESITISQKVPSKAPLMKREEIKIPGREDKGSKVNFQAPKIKEPKIEKIIKISKAGQAQSEAEEFNVEDVKEAVSKFPAFKLPERDITGVLVQKEIIIMEKKTGVTPRGSPCKISSMSTEIYSKPMDKTDEVKQKPSSIVTKNEVIILPKTHDETDIIENKTDQSKTKLKAQHAKPGKMLARDDKISTSPDVKFKLPKREDIEIPGMESIKESVQLQKVKVAKESDTQDEAVKDCTDADVTEKTKIKSVRKGHEKKSKKAKVSVPSFEIMKPDICFPDIGIELPKKATSSKSNSDEIKDINAETKTYCTEQEAITQALEKSQRSKHDTKKADKETPTHEVTQKMTSANEGDSKVTAPEPSWPSVLADTEITGKDTDTDASPHKIKLPKLKMPKIGGISIKGTPEVSTREDVTLQENDTIEVVLDSKKKMSEADKGQSFETDKNWSKLKMPSIDVSLPKVKLTKTEGKSKQEETGLTKPEIDASVGFSKDQIHSESTGPTEEKVEDIDVKVQAADEETEMEAQVEIKDTESKMKKRKISFPKFGFSKSDTKVSDGDVSVSTVQSSLQEGGADVTGIDVEIKTTEVEAELKDSTVSPTKFKIPTIKFPKFGVSFSRATDGRSDIPISDVSTEEATKDVKLPGGTGELTAIPDIKGPEISLSVCKPEVELSLPEDKTDITGIKIPKSDAYCEQKKEIKPSPEVVFSIPKVSLTDDKVNREVTAVELSKPDIKDVEAGVSLPHGGFTTPEGKMEIKEPNVSFTFSKDETEQKDGSAPVKFKLPSINLPKFGVKTSKVIKDMPMVDIDAEEPEVSLPEAEISRNIKDDAPLGDIKESYVTTEGQYEGHSMDMKVQNVKSKEQEGTFKLPKFGISISGVKEPDIDFSKLKTDGDISLIAEKTEVQVSDETFDKPDTDSKGSELKMKRPSFSLPKFGFSKTDAKASEVDLTLQKMDDSKPANSMDNEESIRETNAESEQDEKVLKGSPTKFKLPTLKFPKFGVSLQKTTGADLDNQMFGITEDKPAMEIKLPETELSGEFSTLPKMESSNISLSLSKPEVDVSTLEAAKIDNAHYEIKVLSPEHAFSKPKVKMGLIDHGIAEEPAISDSIIGMDVQDKKFDIEFKPTSVTEDEDIPDTKEKDSETKSKKLKISFPKFGFSKTETKILDVDVDKEGISVPETDVKETEMAIPAPELEVQLKTKSTTGSPSKFKLPTISLPKFDISISKTVEESSAKADDVVKSESRATSAANDIEISKDMASRDKEPSKLRFENLPEDAEIKQKEIDPGSHGSRFMTTKFEISFPKLKRPEGKKGALRTVDNREGTLIHDMESQSIDGKTDVSVAIKETEEKMKKPKVQSSEHGLSKQDIKTPEFKVERRDMSMTTGEVDLKQLESEIKVQTTTTGGSPIKFKLPTFKLPKFGSSASKVKPEVADLSGESHPLEAGVHGKTDFTVVSQVNLDQPNVDTGDMSLPKVELGQPESFEAEVPQFDSKVPAMKTTKTGFSFPKFGFSKSDTKVPVIDISFKEADTSKPEGDVEKKEQSTNITVSKDEVEQTDLTTVSGSTKFNLPSISLPKIGGKATKEEKVMSVIDKGVKGPEASYPDTQIKTSTEPPSANVKELHLVTEGQTVTVDLNVEETELEVQGGKLKLPKFGIGLPKVKGYDLSTPKTGVKVETNLEVQETDIKPTEITEGKTCTMEQDIAGIDLKIKTLPKSVFSKPEMKASEIDVSVKKPDVSIPEGSVDIEVSKMESDQKESTIFGSPTKFKLPSISFPKFGVKSQKADLEIEVTNKKSDSSQPEPKLEVHPSNFEIQDDNTKSADIHEVDSKGLEIKVKRPSFSFPKFGFSKSDFTTPELDASVQKIDPSIPESNVHGTEQTAEKTLQKVEIEAEQKDLTMTGSPTKFKLPTVNLPKFGVKTSKGTVSSEISVPKPEIQVSVQTPTTEIEIREKEIDMCATTGETDIHLAEEKVILPDADIQNIPVKGKADIPVVGLDVKLKKPSFSLPKLGFSKPDIKTQEADTDQPKTEMSTVEGDIPVKKQDAVITFPDDAKESEDPTTVSQTKFKMPSINLPKFGIKYSKATVDISSADVDIKEPEISIPESGEIQTIDIKTDMDIKGSSANVDVKNKGTDFDGLGSKFKLPKLGIGMQKVKETEMQSKETKTPTVLLSEQSDDAIQDVTIEGKEHKIEIESKGLKVKLPKMGLLKPELKAPEADLSLPKTDLDISMRIADVSQQSEDIKSPEKETDLKDDTLIGSPTKFKLPTINFPKFGIKASKITVDTPADNVDMKGPEVSLHDENIKLSAEVPTVDIKGPKVNVENASIEMNIEAKDINKEQQEVKFKIPKFGIALPKIKGSDSEAFTETEEKISGYASIDIKEPTLLKESVGIDKEAKVSEPEAEKGQFKLPKLGISLQKSQSPEIDMHISKAEGFHIETKEAKPSTTEDVAVKEPADLADMSSKGLRVKIKKPSFAFPKIGLSKSDGKTQDIQASDTTVDMSLPEGSVEVGESERDIKSPEGNIEITSPQFGSPTKFKLPTIKLPKFGVSIPKVTGDATKADVDITDVKFSSVDIEVQTQKMDPLDDIKLKTVEIDTTPVNTKAKGNNQEGQENKFKLPKFAISLPKVKGLEVGVAAKEVKTGEPEIGITELEIKTPADDASLAKVDIALQEGSASIQKTEVESEMKDDKAVTGSPSKFKLPTFKMPKFGISVQKTSDIKAEVAEIHTPDIKTDLKVEDKPINVSQDKHIEGEIKETTEQATEVAVKKKNEDKGSPSKFKLPTIKMPKISISRTKSQDEDETTPKVSAQDITTEPKDDLQGPEKSSKFTISTHGDVFRDFDVEFNVPTTEEMEAQKDKPSRKQDSEPAVKVEESADHKDKGAQDKSKFKFKFPKLGFSQSSDESDKLVDAKAEEGEKHVEAPADQKAEGDKEQTKTEKGGWFKFSKFSSPTKTAKIDEKEPIQPSEETEKGSINDVEKENDEANEEAEKSPLSEVLEENLSPTLSLRSSEAFADISSTLTTEQTGPSQTSPTKVKVKYAEPTATIGINDTKVQSDVVTSTARCELISMEPHQPEKVNIPFSSDTSSPSLDTLKQMSGEIHVITTNIQAIPDTQQTAILTNLDAHGIHTSPLQVTLRSDSALTVEETRVQSAKHTFVQRHVVKETLGDDKETILVTHTTRVFEGDSAEPISDETASSIRRLRDTVHTEKMRFFDSVATFEEVKVTSSEISLRHMDSSTDENGENVPSKAEL